MTVKQSDLRSKQQRPARPRRVGLMRRFRRSQEGSTAVEFALLAVPFLMLIFAIFQTSMVHISGQLLQTAVTDASRLIMTGQAQSGGYTATQFKTAVCNRVPAMFNCNSLLYTDVQVYSSLSAATVSAPPVTNGVLNTASFGFNAGGPGDTVVVRAMIQYPIIVPFVGKSFVNLTNNRILIMASAAFQNEPY